MRIAKQTTAPAAAQQTSACPPGTLFGLENETILLRARRGRARTVTLVLAKHLVQLAACVLSVALGDAVRSFSFPYTLPPASKRSKTWAGWLIVSPSERPSPIDPSHLKDFYIIFFPACAASLSKSDNSQDKKDRERRTCGYPRADRVKARQATSVLCPLGLGSPLRVMD
jgi:hypothetical protein